MNIHDNIDWLADVLLRKSVQFWAKRNPRSLDMQTHTHANSKRYIIHICRCDYKEYTGDDK